MTVEIQRTKGGAKKKNKVDQRQHEPSLPVRSTVQEQQSTAAGSGGSSVENPETPTILLSHSTPGCRDASPHRDVGSGDKMMEDGSVMVPVAGVTAAVPPSAKAGTPCAVNPADDTDDGLGGSSETRRSPVSLLHPPTLHEYPESKRIVTEGAKEASAVDEEEAKRKTSINVAVKSASMHDKARDVYGEHHRLEDGACLEGASPPLEAAVSSSAIGVDHDASDGGDPMTPPSEPPTSNVTSTTEYDHRYQQREIFVPNHKVGLVIGKGGSHVVYFQHQSGAAIHIARESDEIASGGFCTPVGSGGAAVTPDGMRRIALLGTPEQTAAAADMIQRLIETSAERGDRAEGQREHKELRYGSGGGFGGSSFGSGGSFGGSGSFSFGSWPSSGSSLGGYPRGFSGDPFGKFHSPRGVLGRRGHGDAVYTISIPHKKVGLIIGRGGENIRFLQQQTRAHIQIQTEQDSPPNQPERTVFLRGPREACSEAAVMIQDMVDGMFHIGTASLVPPQPVMPPNVSDAQAHQIYLQPKAQANHLSEPWATRGAVSSMPAAVGRGGTLETDAMMKMTMKSTAAVMAKGNGPGNGVVGQGGGVQHQATVATGEPHTAFAHQRHYGSQQSAFPQYGNQYQHVGGNNQLLQPQLLAFTGGVTGANAGWQANAGFTPYSPGMGAALGGTTYYQSAPEVPYAQPAMDGSAPFYPFPATYQQMHQTQTMNPFAAMQYWQQCLEFYSMGADGAGGGTAGTLIQTRAHQASEGGGTAAAPVQAQGKEATTGEESPKVSEGEVIETAGDSSATT